MKGVIWVQALNFLALIDVRGCLKAKAKVSGRGIKETNVHSKVLLYSTALFGLYGETIIAGREKKDSNVTQRIWVCREVLKVIQVTAVVGILTYNAKI